MATPDTTAGEVFIGARALLNDQENQEFTNTILLPYLRTAFRELREYFEQSNIPVTNVAENILSLAAGTVVVSFTSTPALPADLVEIRQVWARQANTDPWFPLTRREFIPPALEGIEYSEFIYWAWVSNELRLMNSNQTQDLKLQYIRQLTEPVNENSVLGVINGLSFLEARTAALAARFAMENVERAQELDAQATVALDRVINVENKAKQAIYTRRRPFRANWKARTPF